MLCGVALSYTLPEWDRISVLNLSCSLLTVLVITPGSLPSCLANLTSPVPLSLNLCLCLFVGLSVFLSVCMWPRLDFEGLENGEDGFLDKAKSWSRSIEDLHHTSTQPFCNTLVRSARQSVLRYVLLSLLPCYYLSMLLARSANLECYKRVLASMQVVMVLFCFKKMPEWLISYSSVTSLSTSRLCSAQTQSDDELYQRWKKNKQLKVFNLLSPFVNGPPSSVQMCICTVFR